MSLIYQLIPNSQVTIIILIVVLTQSIVECQYQQQNQQYGGHQQQQAYGQPQQNNYGQQGVPNQGGQNLLHDQNRIHDREHIKEHLHGVIQDPDLSKMSEEELQFHYFKMHDNDNNNKLDGTELIKSLIHWHGLYSIQLMFCNNCLMIMMI